MIYAVLAAIIFSLGAGFYGGWSWESGRWAKAEEKRVEAEAMITALSDKAIDDAEKALNEKQQAFKDGETSAAGKEKIVIKRVTTQLTQYPVFKNPACVLPEDSYGLLRAALLGVRSGVVVPDAPVPVPTSPAAAAPTAPTSVGPTPSGKAPPKPVPKKAANP